VPPVDQTSSRLSVLGPIEVTGPHGPIQIREGMARKLLSALAIKMSEPIPSDVLIEELWGERQPLDARNALHVLVSYLRRVLDPVKSDITLERSGSSYRLTCADPAILDSVVFERTVQSIQDVFTVDELPRAAEAALECADRALSLWRGTPFAESMYDEFAQVETARLRELRAIALERRGRALLALGRNADAVESLQALVGEYPLRESVWGALIVALYRSHRQADALRAYGTARDHLVDELGVEPGPELRDLERRVLDQDASLDSDPPCARAVHQLDRPRDAVVSANAAPAPVWTVDSYVPEPVSTLVGRGFEAAHVRRLVEQTRLTTLTGPGGVGKSRLAVEVALAVKDSWPTRFVEFGGLPADSDVTLLIASELGVPSVPRASSLDAVAMALGDGDSLVVFDTCEHLIDQIAAAASGLLQRNPGVHILATSRLPLGVSGETVWSVPPLDLPDDDARTLIDVAASNAVRLFVARAVACRPDFVLDDGNAAAVAEICRRLDGLPLAIELAAARVKILSPARIVERLGDRFALLSHGARTAETRQRSLWALIEWSYDLLGQDERSFFDRLGVFGGSFDFDAAAVIAGDAMTEAGQTEFSIEPLDLLGALVEHSLVNSTESDRFVLLDTLRAFAQSQLDSKLDAHDASAIRTRHAQWYLDIALSADPKSHGPLPGSWPQLRAEAANCIAALEWLHHTGDLVSVARLAGALAGFWMLEGQIAHADRWLRLVQSADLDDATRASVMRGIGVLELYQSRFAESVEATTQSVAAARRTADIDLVGSCLLTLGGALWGVGRFEESSVALSEAVTIFAATSDARGHGFALARLGRTQSALEDESAITHLQTATSLLAASGEGWMACVAAEHLASALLHAGRHDAAVAAAQRAVGLGERVGSRAGRMAALLTLGRALVALGDSESARRTLVVALADATRSGNPGGIADAVDGLAQVSSSCGDVELAVELMALSDALREQRHVAVPTVVRAARSALIQALGTQVAPDRYDDLRRSGGQREVRWVVERVTTERPGADLGQT
jgi:predicted ATPase/DNA-binding SARP family transcriptional activator